MEYLYHRVPENMTGTVLYPLNQLKILFPDVFVKHVGKYERREHLLETKIPVLECLWNDVLHFTAVPPNVLYKNMSGAGCDAQTLVWKQWYKVPKNLLDAQNTIVCLYRRDVDLIPQARDFHAFDPNAIHLYAAMPLETVEYYKQKCAVGERPLFFHRVPHILFKGSIDVTRLEIVSPV